MIKLFKYVEKQEEMSNSRRILQSKYKHVGGETDGTNVRWHARLAGCSRKRYIEERAAALAVDTFLINQGKQPVNILTKKNQDENI